MDATPEEMYIEGVDCGDVSGRLGVRNEKVCRVSRNGYVLCEDIWGTDRTFSESVQSSLRPNQ